MSKFCEVWDDMTILQRISFKSLIQSHQFAVYLRNTNLKLSSVLETVYYMEDKSHYIKKLDEMMGPLHFSTINSDYANLHTRLLDKDCLKLLLSAKLMELTTDGTTGVMRMLFSGKHTVEEIETFLLPISSLLSFNLDLNLVVMGMDVVRDLANFFEFELSDDGLLKVTAKDEENQKLVKLAFNGAKSVFMERKLMPNAARLIYNEMTISSFTLMLIISQYWYRNLFCLQVLLMKTMQLDGHIAAKKRVSTPLINVKVKTDNGDKEICFDELTSLIDQIDVVDSLEVIEDIKEIVTVPYNKSVVPFAFKKFVEIGQDYRMQRDRPLLDTKSKNACSTQDRDFGFKQLMVKTMRPANLIVADKSFHLAPVTPYLRAANAELMVISTKGLIEQKITYKSKQVYLPPHQVKNYYEWLLKALGPHMKGRTQSMLVLDQLELYQDSAIENVLPRETWFNINNEGFPWTMCNNNLKSLRDQLPNMLLLFESFLFKLAIPVNHDYFSIIGEILQILLNNSFIFFSNLSENPHEHFFYLQAYKTSTKIEDHVNFIDAFFLDLFKGFAKGVLWRHDVYLNKGRCFSVEASEVHTSHSDMQWLVLDSGRFEHFDDMMKYELLNKRFGKYTKLIYKGRGMVEPCESPEIEDEFKVENISIPNGKTDHCNDDDVEIMPLSLDSCPNGQTSLAITDEAIRELVKERLGNIGQHMRSNDFGLLNRMSLGIDRDFEHSKKNLEAFKIDLILSADNKPKYNLLDGTYNFDLGEGIIKVTVGMAPELITGAKSKSKKNRVKVQNVLDQITAEFACAI